ncbi:hypothetical protein [Gemella sanguinis]|uniref:hypothetical protein n=1 Tax=Gemella sanguinis TaxID=84135 RepID=UPI0028D14F2B|nr:hypothetical protein [Gemella sanguinis]
MTLEGGVSVPAEEKINVSKAVEEVEDKKTNEEIDKIADETKEVLKEIGENKENNLLQ